MIKLCPSEVCTGCSSCINACPKNCIKMIENLEGFLYPVIDNKLCVECGMCQNVCPELNIVPKNSNPIVYASWSLKDKIRMSSSSGGLFFAIAQHIINKGGVVYGVVFNDDMSVSHKSAVTLDELRFMQGSKYIQSNINMTYKEALSYLKKDRYVMFTGTPCQIAGFKSFLGNKIYNNLILVDIVCHGTPPAKMLKWYLNELKKKLGDFNESTFCFRNLNAWGVTPSVEISKTRHYNYW